MDFKNLENSQVIDIINSFANYEELKESVIKMLQEEIKSKGLDKIAERCNNLTEEFIPGYFKMIVFGKREEIETLIGLKTKHFSEEEIANYAQTHKVPNVSMEIALSAKAHELFGIQCSESEKKQVEEYNKLPEEEKERVMTNEEALKEMEKERNSDIAFYTEKIVSEINSKIMSFHKYGVIRITSDPKNYDVGQLTTKILLGDLKVDDTSGTKNDFYVNKPQVQILANGFIYVYQPNKHYPEDMLKSAYLQQEEEKKLKTELNALYEKYRDKNVDFLKIYQQVIAGKELSKEL